MKLGQDIDGEAASDLSGFSVSLDGNRVAIGAPGNDDNGSGAGHVRVYDLVAGVCTQVGTDIDGEDAGDQSGFSVSLDGDRVAIGAQLNDGIGLSAGHVRIYQYNGIDWIQVGDDIDGEAVGDESGYSVSLDGDRVAIGAPLNAASNAGHVRVYDLVGGVWTQVGQDIDGETGGDQSGFSVSLDGDRVAIGAPINSNTNAGHVRVYDLVGGVWTKVGQDIDGEAANDRSGTSVSLDGDRVAIGARLNDGSTGSDAGHVRVYDLIGGVWTKVGQDIDGEAANDWSGSSVSLDGDRVAIGALLNDGSTGSNTGHVRVYQFDGTAWTQAGTDIDGEAASDLSGCSVSLSGDRVAIGARGNDDNGSTAGHVRVYDLSAVLPVTLTAFTAAPASSADVTLAWATASERNSSHFRVEHARDATTWRTLAEVASAGDTDAGQAYAHTHADAGAGLHYYRLAAVDRDGSTEYSAVVSVTLGGDNAGVPTWAAQMSVYPNPVSTGELQLAGLTDGGEALTATVTDVVGRVHSVTRLAAGRPNGALALGQLAPGVYVLTVQDASGQVASRRFVVAEGER